MSQSFAINKNKEMIVGLDSHIYWRPTKDIFDEKLRRLAMESNGDENVALQLILRNLTEVLIASSDGVERIIQQRLNDGIIRDAGQARVNAAGSNYQSLIAYALVKNIISGNLPPFYVVLKPKKHKIAKKYLTVKVGGEEQKPDMDIMIYKEEKDTPAVIYSCKTSLRERAGQTYRWKLLVDAASCISLCKHEPNCRLKQLDISYESERPIRVGFITADLYGEINQPQHRGMFKFFDYAYNTNNNTTVETVKTLDHIINDLRDLYQ